MQELPERCIITRDTDGHYVLRWYAPPERFGVILRSFTEDFPSRTHAVLEGDRWRVPPARQEHLVAWVLRMFPPDRIACDDPALFGQAAARRMAYTTYLESEAWATKREQVRDRERRRQQRPEPLCEACWSSPGVEIHHGTYQHIMADEPLFELYLVCRSCNQRLFEGEGG